MAMEFALFYEIPVARPWGPRSEHEAYRHAVEAAVLGEAMGFHSFWTVEHHFLEEFSHCSSPEALYGMIAAKTTRIRIGHGVRLLPFPYNHPVRAAESAAVLDLLCDGRLEFGTGRSSTRDELEGFGIDPHRTRELWEEGVEMVVRAWTDDVFEWSSPLFRVPKRRVVPKPLQQPHPPLWGATSSPPSHRLMGEKGMGLLSFTIGTPPEELKQRIDLYREGLAVAKPVGRFVNPRAATFTMVHCAPTAAAARANAAESFEWYARRGTRRWRRCRGGCARPGATRAPTPTATRSPTSTRASSPSTSSPRAGRASSATRRHRPRRSRPRVPFASSRQSASDGQPRGDEIIGPSGRGPLPAPGRRGREGPR